MVCASCSREQRRSKTNPASSILKKHLRSTEGGAIAIVTRGENKASNYKSTPSSLLPSIKGHVTLVNQLSEETVGLKQAAFACSLKHS